MRLAGMHAICHLGLVHTENSCFTKSIPGLRILKVGLCNRTCLGPKLENLERKSPNSSISHTMKCSRGAAESLRLLYCFEYWYCSCSGVCTAGHK